MTKRAAKVGDTVRHFSNAACVATVVRVVPKRQCGDYGMGNWLRGGWAPQPLLVVEYSNGHTDEEFASAWTVVE